jgi:hypothetical protein
MHIPVGMNSSHNVNLSYSGKGVFFGKLNQFVDAQFPAAFLPLFSTIRAEGTMVDANVGGFQMDVAVEIDLLPVDPVANMISQNSQKWQGAFLVEQNSLFGGDALAGSNIFGYLN